MSVRWATAVSWAALLVVAFARPGVAADLVLEGEWTIVRPEYPKENNGLTKGFVGEANVLCEVLGESVGVKARSVVEGQQPPGPGHRIFIGAPFAEAAGLMPADFKGYDWGIAEKDGDLYFFGRDRTGANPREPNCCVMPSALATAQFMRHRIGVLFLMPGNIGREVPKLERLSVPKGYSRRGTVTAPFQTGRAYDYPYNMANNIYGRGAAHTYGGHTYPAACPREKYFKTHPEYFAKNAKGDAIWGGSHGCQAYCISNPEFRRLVYEEMLKRYDAGAEICQLGQNDGSAHECRCKACHDLYGTGDDWCEKIWLYHKEIAERIMKDRPGKIVHIMCYGDTANPPKTFKVFPPNVMIEVCRHTDDDMKKWDGYTVPHGFTYYIYNWSWYPILGFTPKRSIAGLVRQVKRFHKYGMKGIYRCGYGEMFGMEGPAYWVFNHLVENPDINVRGALAQYYGGAFGPASQPMKRFYEDLEEPLAEVERRNSTKASDLVEGTIKRTKRRDPVEALSTVYTPERVARMDAALKEAETTPGLSEKQVRRLELVRTEWNYVRNVGTIARMYKAFRENPTKAGCDEILAALRVRNKMVEEFFPNGKMRRMKGWPEVLLFGNPPLEHFKVNGRLGAPIYDPLAWDVDRMIKYRIVPNEKMTPDERAAEMKAAGLKPITGFAIRKEDFTPEKGTFFEPYPDHTGFRFGQGSNGHVRVSARIGPKQGLLAGKTYKVTWLTRWENVNVEHPWHGYYFTAMFDTWRQDGKDKCMLQQPKQPLHDGTSDGWLRESGVMTICDKPGFTSEFTFRFWRGTNGVAEVRDVTIEEVEP